MRWHISRFIPQKTWQKLCVMFLMGAISALALPPINFFFILPFTLFPLYYFTVFLAKNWKQSFILGFSFGMGFHIAGLYWLTNAILTRIHEFWWVIPFATPAVAFVIAPLMAVPGVGARFGKTYLSKILIFSSLWELADMSRVLIFTGFPWNPLGSAVEMRGKIGDILIQLGSVIGVDGIGLLLVLLSLLCWQGRKALLSVGVSCILWCGFGIWHLSHTHFLEVKNPSLVLIQGNVPESEVVGHMNARARFAFYLKATDQGTEKALLEGKGAQEHRPFIVVWPESAFPALLEEDILARQEIAWAAHGATALIGTPRTENGLWYNALEALNPRGEIIARYDKSRLVPFGEYQPKILPFNMIPFVFTSGEGVKTWDMPETGRVGPMICYEIIFSGSVTEKGKRPNWLLTISNDAWYGNSAGPRQHLATGRMRAVEEAIPVVFVNNRGVSAIYDSQGHEVVRTKWGSEETVIIDIPPPQKPSIFALWGRSIPLFLSIMIAIIGFIIDYLLFTSKRKV